MGHAEFFQNTDKKKDHDAARIKIGPLRMALAKRCPCERPREISLVVPRVEIRTCLKTPFFTFTKETVYNSVTIVDAPVGPMPESGRPPKTIR